MKFSCVARDEHPMLTSSLAGAFFSSGVGTLPLFSPPHFDMGTTCTLQ
jgi:hypothetical protein